MKAALILAAIAALVAVFTQTSGPDANAVPTADEVASRTMSPFCEGLTLNECPHSKSAALRAEIDSMIRAGATNRQIDDWMERNYGIVSQGRPGAGVAWLAPPAIAVLGLVAVLLLLRNRRSREPAPEPAPSEFTQADEKRFAEDFGSYVKGTE